MRTLILPYHKNSRSARLLAESLDARRLRLVRTRSFGIREDDRIINWGAGKKQAYGVFGEAWEDVNYVNHPTAVTLSSNKLRAFRAMQAAGVNVPDFTSDVEVAVSWYLAGHKVVMRKKLRGHSGRGITICDPELGAATVPQEAPLYTKYVPKYDEFRVHVAFGSVIDVQQKKRRHGHENVNSQVRSYGNGWVFCREGIEPHQSVLDEAVAAVASLGLDFGAADVGFTRSGSIATIYEVNTACGLEGSTIDSYTAALSRGLG